MAKKIEKKSEKQDKEKKDKKEKKSFATEFKEFISRGSVMDLAVGIIIGSAFTAIVNSLVADIITPFVGLVIGGIDFSSLSVTLPSIFTDEPAVLSYGKFIQAVMNFFIIAICVFTLIKIMNTLRRKMEQDLLKKKQQEEKKEEPKPEPKPEPTVVLLEEIRDLLKSEKSNK